MSNLPLRQAWKERSRNDAGFLTSVSSRFIETHGASAEFANIGLDSEVQGNKRIYHSQPYAIFNVSGHGRFIFTVGELDSLAKALDHVQNSDIRANMTNQLAKAAKAYKSCLPALDGLMGQVRVVGDGQTLRAPVLKAVK